MKELWVEKYRPKSLNEYIFHDDDVEDMIRGYVNAGDIPNLLLSGTQGVGKSTLVRVLMSELGINDSDILRLNASSQSGIDVVREKIEPWCSNSVALYSRFKVVILEEASGLTKAAQDSLKDVTEIHSDSCRFIFTCNHVDKISAPIRSRFQEIDMKSFKKINVLELVANILTKENIEVDNVDFMKNHVDKFFPDVRKIINSIHQCSITGKLKDVYASNVQTEIEDEWQKLWNNKPTYDKLVKHIKNVDNNNYERLFVIMYESIDNLDKGLIDNALLAVSEHLYRASSITNQSINMHGCLIKVFKKL